MVKMSSSLRNVLILIVLSYIFFMFGNGVMSLSNPDEVFYTQTAKEMVGHSTWTVPYLFGGPNFEKPIFLYWLMRVAFIIFGITCFAARFFPALFAGLGVLAVYCLGLLGFKDEKKAFLSALIIMSSGLYIGLGRTVFTDMIFSVWIVIALVLFYWGYVNNKRKNLSVILFFIAGAFAVLTKGPLGIIIPLTIVVLFLLLKRQLKYLFNWYVMGGIVIFAAVALPWYIDMIKQYGTVFTHEFFYNDHVRRILEAEHRGNDTWFFYLMSMVACMFPWSIFVPFALFSAFKRNIFKDNAVYLFIACWIAVVFGIFQVAHSKLVSYILPLFPVVALLIGDYIDVRARALRNKSLSVLLISNWLIITLFVIAIPFALNKFPQYLSNKIPAYSLVLVLFCSSLLMLRFIITGKFSKVVFITAAFLPTILFVVPFIKSDIEPYISSRQIGEYIDKNIDKKSVILCAKPFVRGVGYYSNRDVAILNAIFFSPMSIPVLDSDDKIVDFLNKQKVTYCVLKEPDNENIERVARKGFRYSTMKSIGDEYIVKVESVK